MTLAAYEMLSAMPDSWHHGVLIHTPKPYCPPNGGALIKLGRDADAIRDGDDAGILFDLGVESLAFRFCVRLFEPEQVEFAEQYLGERVLHTGCELFQRLQEWHAHRVLFSSVGRIGVSTNRIVGRQHTEGPAHPFDP